MYILFSPSEEKLKSENDYTIDEIKTFFSNLNQENFSIKSDFRQSFIKVFIDNFSDLSNLFGIKDPAPLLKNFSPALHEAIELYQGVSYKELDYKTLKNYEKNYLKKHLIIFSNLFGPLLASDKIPFYKLKQGVKLNKINQAKEYEKDTQAALNALINDCVIDLRADIYKDYFRIRIPSASVVFTKSGKQLSHSSKVHRGRLLRRLAEQNITNLKEFSNMIATNYDLIKSEKLDQQTIFHINIKE